MQEYQRKIQLIQSILKKHPKGLTVSDIAKKIKTNRNSVAKYLDIMRISGQVEMTTFGPAKVFFSSRRVPIKDLLNYASDYIIVIDENLRIIEINNALLRFLHEDRGKFIGQYLNKTPLFFINNTISISINEALAEKGGVKNIDLFNEPEEIYFKIKIIPIKFEDGSHGVSLILKNITHQKRVQNLLKEWAKPHITTE